MSNNKIKNTVGFGKDLNEIAQPIGVGGEENNELLILSMTELDLFQGILTELKKFNIQLESITNTKITRKDAISYKQRL